MSARELAAVAAALFLWGSGCAPTAVRETTRMPFHVAVVPFRAEEVEDDSRRTADVVEMNLKVDGLRLSRRIARRLEKECFTRVTLLEYPEGFAERSLDERKRWLENEARSHWAQEALRARADLVFESRCVYSRTVRSEKNQSFWLNLPLFFLGGPFNYYIEDRNYYVRAELEVLAHDTNLLRSEAARLTNDSSWKTLEPWVRTVTLSFVDRVGDGELGTFALSLVVPAGFLSVANEVVERNLADKVADMLVTNLLARLQSSAADICSNVPFVDFYVEPESVRIWPRANDSVGFSAAIVLRRDGGVDRLLKYVIHANGESKENYFETEPVPAGGFGDRVRYQVEETMPLGGAATTVQLRVWQDDAVGSARSFTFPLDQRASDRDSRSGT